MKPHQGDMQLKKYLYTFGYDKTESELCKLESKYIFNQEEKDRLLFSDIKVNPSSSPFIKRRIEIISYDDDFANLVDKVKKENLDSEGFKVEYIVFDGDETEYAERLSKLKDVGFNIAGDPDYYHPTIIYAIWKLGDIWYFGILVKNNLTWRNHNKKPRSYSNSIIINIAKSIVNIAAKGDRNKKLLDVCCGVGTIMLEACFAGYDIEGCDINWKICNNARVNLAHFNYTANVYRSDIKDITKEYDAAIIDLPYNILSVASDNDIRHIIESAAKITDRLVIVSVADISNLIKDIGFSISDYCSISKSGKRTFSRKIWVCEKGIKD